MLAKPEEQREVLLPVQERLKAQLDGIAARSHKKGYAQGYAEECAEALERERVLLHQIVAFRFGAETAQHLDPLLAATEDPKRLVDVAIWLTECATGKELLERVRNAD